MDNENQDKMDEEEKKFKEAAQELLDEVDVLEQGSAEELEWLVRAEKMIIIHRLHEIIRGKKCET